MASTSRENATWCATQSQSLIPTLFASKNRNCMHRMRQNANPSSHRTSVLHILPHGWLSGRTDHGLKPGCHRGRRHLTVQSLSLCLLRLNIFEPQLHCHTNVYAPSDHRDSDLFFEEFESITQPGSTNWITIGDYNLTRAPIDKNNNNFDCHLANKFNNLIDGLALIELPFLIGYTLGLTKGISPP